MLTLPVQEMGMQEYIDMLIIASPLLILSVAVPAVIEMAGALHPERCVWALRGYTS